MKQNDLRSMGISEENADLFLKVQKLLDSHPDSEYENNPKKVYQLCLHSGKFTTEELKVIANAYNNERTPGIIELIISLLKKLFGK